MTSGRESTTRRIERLNDASVRRAIDPTELLAGRLGPGQLIPDELLSVAELGLDLTPEQKVRLAREEVASFLRNGIEFEAVLMAGFALQIAHHPRRLDGSAVYALHEIGEESRHSRVFIELLRQIEEHGPTAAHPLGKGVVQWAGHRANHLIIAHEAVLYSLVLGGEEIPDLMQRLIAEHPDSDPHLVAVNRYHRAEETRHISFARARLPEIWAEAGPVERAAVHRVVPRVIGMLWDLMIQPGVYETIGLPGWDTWRARPPFTGPDRPPAPGDAPIVGALLEAGALEAGKVPEQWRQLAGVDRSGTPPVGPGTIIAEKRSTRVVATSSL